MLQKPCYNSLFCFAHSRPLGVQKEPQSAMVKTTKPITLGNRFQLSKILLIT